MAGRGFHGDYRFGYQGSEKDDEVSGEGNSYTTEFRQLDPRLGRWFSVDPIFQPWQSPYTSMDNNPIGNTDVKGDKIGDFFRGGLGDKYINGSKVTSTKGHLATTTDVNGVKRYYRFKGAQGMSDVGVGWYEVGAPKGEKVTPSTQAKTTTEIIVDTKNTKPLVEQSKPDPGHDNTNTAPIILPPAVLTVPTAPKRITPKEKSALAVLAGALDQIFCPTGAIVWGEGGKGL